MEGSVAPPPKGTAISDRDGIKRHLDGPEMMDARSLSELVRSWGSEG